MTRTVFRRIAAAVALLPALSCSLALAADVPVPQGQQVYVQACAACHDHPKDRIPPREQVARRTPEEVVQALTSGVMREQAAGLTLNERIAVATHLTGRAPIENARPVAEPNPCRNLAAPLSLDGPQWNGWGNGLTNTRFQPQPGLAAADVPRLKLKWAYGYRGSSIYGQPTLVGGRLFATSVTGRVYSLDARTGCTYWTFDGAAPARPATSVVQVPGVASPVLFFGDDSATVYALDAQTGKLRWRFRLDTHPSARITGAPAFHGTRLYVPVSSLEELSALAPTYECCKFRGAVVALDAASGALLWRTYTVDGPVKPYRKASNGTQQYGPAGGAVWSAPTIDEKRGLLYVGTGNSYTDVATRYTNAVLALELATGRIRWANQVLPGDNYIVGCEGEVRPVNCPKRFGPDVDFGTSPLLRTLPNGHEVLMTGAKSALVHALDPDRNGRTLWRAKVGTGGPIGGIEWGGAADESRLYLAVSDITDTTNKGPGGLTAVDIATGKAVWRVPAPKPVCSWGTRSCSAAQSQAVTAIPGVVFAGSHDGHLRAYAAEDGRIVWDFDTGVAFANTVNGVPAAGGSLDHGGATVVGGMVYVNSGYGRINGQPGNVLLAFGLE
jgi:polyvinyl alcohol dehydrogenase (cytochrome)